MSNPKKSKIASDGLFASDSKWRLEDELSLATAAG
jgi:hypothetical protein